MKLEDILKDMEIILILGPKNIDIKSVEYDSRNLKEDSLFICIKGANVNGHDFIEEAKIKGAKAFLIEENVEKNDGYTYIKVKSTNVAMSFVAKNFYDNPSSKIKLIGVTGTNGKTSVATFLKEILSVEDKCGFIGTTGIYDGKKTLNNNNTTPNSLEIQKNLNQMYKNNCKYCSMEVSSHALFLKRVENLKFNIGIFTNLTEDHLDFHKTFENYRNAKEALFYKTTTANIINIDDINGKMILDKIRNLKVPYYTYGIKNQATFRGKNIKLYDNKTIFTLIGPNDFQEEITLDMVGLFTVYNCLATICACYILGINIREIIERLKKIKCVSGRLEKVENDKNLNIFVDYAHTPDALENVLKSIKHFVRGNIITVFGCGGNREKEKRAIMGAIAQKRSDLTIITSDNPRYEEPLDIINDIIKGMDINKRDFLIIENREEAIKEAISVAEDEDVILIAGKGHEDYQIIKDKKIHFDDKEVVKKIIKESCI